METGTFIIILAGSIAWMLSTTCAQIRCVAEIALIVAVIYCVTNIKSINSNGLHHWSITVPNKGLIDI